MLKVFLVEDEVVVREGIKNNIDWASHGYEFCGEASDGELAFPMIKKLQPDILITDIKMPFMDGLTLSKMVKKEFPWMEIIILTGYQEFEYAKEGIKIGVSRYLSKPISGAELLKEVDAMAEQIREKRREMEIREKYSREMEESIEREKKNLFEYLVNGQKTAAELFEIAEKLNINLSAIWYNIVLIKARSMKHGQEEYSNSLVLIDREMKSYVYEENIIGFEGHFEGKYLIFKADTLEELEESQERFVAHVEQIFAKYENAFYFGGIGVPVNRLTDLPLSYDRANQALAQQYLVKGNQILNSSGLEKNVSDQDFDIRKIEPKQMDGSKVTEFLKFGTREEVPYFVEAFFEGLGKQATSSKMFLQYITMNTYFGVVNFVEELQISRDEIEPIDVASEVLSNSERAIQYLIRIMEKAIELRDGVASNRYAGVVDEVMRYIEENYAMEELSLNVLASAVNFSPNHLSSVFSQQTGQTIIKYLTDFRMNKAKELLRCTGKRSSAISIEVGYKDPHYFSYLFKKTQGMTPTQYRGGKGIEGEE